MATDMTTERAYEWDDEIEQDNEYTLLPEGEYNFEVIKFERGVYNGGDKIPACKKAILTIRLSDGKNSAVITHNFFLHSKCEGLLSAFFTSIGQKKHGEKVRMNWNAVTGAKGRCKVKIDTYNGNQYNKISSFLPPKETPANTYSGF